MSRSQVFCAYDKCQKPFVPLKKGQFFCCPRCKHLAGNRTAVQGNKRAGKLGKKLAKKLEQDESWEDEIKALTTVHPEIRAEQQRMADKMRSVPSPPPRPASEQPQRDPKYYSRADLYELPDTPLPAPESAPEPVPISRKEDPAPVRNDPFAALDNMLSQSSVSPAHLLEYLTLRKEEESAREEFEEASKMVFEAEAKLAAVRERIDQLKRGAAGGDFRNGSSSTSKANS